MACQKPGAHDRAANLGHGQQRVDRLADPAQSKENEDGRPRRPRQDSPPGSARESDLCHMDQHYSQQPPAGAEHRKADRAEPIVQKQERQAETTDAEPDQTAKRRIPPSPGAAACCTKSTLHISHPHKDSERASKRIKWILTRRPASGI